MRISAGCVLAAVGLDALNNLIFFVDWTVFARSLTVTVAVALLIAYPVISTVANAHLALYRTKSELEELSRRDPLTALGNRRAMMDRVGGIQPRPLMLVIADIDRFKSINDIHGHRAGDNVLTECGAIMAEELGDLGAACRIGGEEFALVAESVDAAMIRRRLAAFARRIAATTFEHDGRSFSVTVSIGAAQGAPGQPFDEVYSAADRALYVAKAAGRDTICFDVDMERPLLPPPPDEIMWSDDVAADGEPGGDRRSDAA
ncbi:MAG TPA: GGDEF domain-containing protein [Methylomirabilota bacterium]|nr:GGDEF domain-containing protein [Methylomirabilota bacterium]